VDNNICKLDGGTLDVINKINLPNVKIDIEKYIQCLQRFEGQVIIQTLFLRGKHHNDNIDNTTEEEINLWLEHLKKIKPRKTMIYVIDRETPEKNLEKLSSDEMSKIADKVKALGLNVEYYS
jgi:wyosine [tRNA(Phe)-imidazoG37] synthetase (radical SAM superfamily)